MASHNAIAVSAQKAGMKAHSSGDLVTAGKLYRRALAYSATPSYEVFANYGALLRQLNNPKQAEVVYRRGLKIHRKQMLLLRNYGNLLLQEGKYAKSLNLYLQAEYVALESNQTDKIQLIRRQQAEVLTELGQLKLALSLLNPILQNLECEDVDLQLGIANLYAELNQIDKARDLALPILEQKEPSFNEAYQWSNLLLKLGEFDKALEKFDNATSSHRRQVTGLDKNTKQKFDTTCWNFALMLLRRGLLKRGWELFEHGRAVPNGRGGMQRTVFKAHPRSKIKEWEGENITNKRLLINGEQGIGDVMMFSMLIMPLFEEAKEIGIVTYDRLIDLYKRSFPKARIFNAKSMKSGSIQPEEWDLQVAMGSLPKLRHQNIKDYETLQPFLVADSMQKDELTDKYHPESTDETLIGFSWKGGGNSKQKRTKSLKLEDMLPLFQLPKIRWISLQYGDVENEINCFNEKYNLNLIVPDDVDPLKDMDRWCSLVSCCDKVVSAANTTIHGAGCLGIPTTVILARDPDWRWLGDHHAKCYWYSCVSIARQKQVGSWHEPIQEVLRSLC